MPPSLGGSHGAQRGGVSPQKSKYSTLMKHSSGLTARLRGLVRREGGERERGGGGRGGEHFNHFHHEVVAAESLLLLQPPQDAAASMLLGVAGPISRR